MQYSIDPEKKLAYLTIPEKTDLTEILEALRQLAADERFGDDFGLLVDVRATTFIPTTGEARAIAVEISRPALFLSHPIAAVVLQPVQYGIGNMVSIIAGLKGAVLRVFYDREAAERWLQSRHKQV